MARRPLSSAERDALILQATSAARCWLVVSAGAVLAGLGGMIHLA